MSARLIIGCLLLLGCGAPARAQPVAKPAADAPRIAPELKVADVKLKRYEAGDYVIYTDVSEEGARETVLRMTRMAEEYQARTRTLFARPDRRRLPFYLFSKPADYYKASDRPDSAGVFTGDALLATVLPDSDDNEPAAAATGAAPGIGNRTWRIVQHEGFHQYADAAGRARMPTWINEGLAEYFSQSLFTGDGMVSGLIPASRLRIIQGGIKSADFKSFPELLRMSHETWNLSLTHAQYDQAWSMVHFLMHADHGKYEPALAQAILLSSQRLATDRAWITAFGSVEAFEDKWKDYWLKLPENPTLERYAQAVVSTFAAYLARAAAQGQTFADFSAILHADPSTLKIADADWLPPRLFTQTKQLCVQLGKQGASFTLKAGTQITCTLPDGTQVKAPSVLNEQRPN